MTEEEYPSGARLVAFGDDVGVEACEECEPFRFGKGGFMCFDFRAPVVTRLVRHSPVAYRVGSQCTRRNKGMSR